MNTYSTSISLSQTLRLLYPYHDLTFLKYLLISHLPTSTSDTFSGLIFINLKSPDCLMYVTNASEASVQVY